MATEQRRKLTHYKAQIERDHLGQSDLADGFGGFKEGIVEIDSVPVLYRPRQPRSGEKLNKYLIRFKGKRKAWLSGPVTQATIASMYGPYLEEWVGKCITLYVDPDVKMKGERTGGIRVRPIVPRGSVTTDPMDQPIDEAGAAQREAAANAANDEQQQGGRPEDDGR